MFREVDAKEVKLPAMSPDSEAAIGKDSTFDERADRLFDGVILSPIQRHGHWYTWIHRKGLVAVEVLLIASLMDA